MSDTTTSEPPARGRSIPLAARLPAGESSDMTLNGILDGTASRCPNRTAIVTATQSLSYGELRRRVLKAAAAFKARGILKGDCVGLVLRNSPEFVVAYLGLNRIGAVAVPINFMIQKSDELRFMLEDCAAKGVVTQNEFLKGLLEARRSLPGLKDVWVTDSAAAPGCASFEAFVESGDASAAEGDPARPGEIAAILYTSGTTGSPKGVMLSHANMATNCDASIQVMGLTEKDVSLCILPMFHTFAWTAVVLLSLRLGGKLVVSPSITPAAAWLKMMGRHGVTTFAAVPPVYAVLAREVRGFKGLILKYWFFRRVRFCVSGAAPLSVDVAKAFQGAMGLPILEGYGLTETSPVATINPPGRLKAGSVGPAIPGVEVKVVSDDGRDLPPGEEGEVFVRGPNLMLGYHNRPEANREIFTPDGWLKTGDIGVLDADGYLALRDRKKDMIIVKGLKVFSAQVEQVILTHPEVEEVAVVGVPEPNGDEVIKAFIVPRAGCCPAKAALLQFFREKFDPYKRPRDVELVESLPKNALQKVLKRVLRQRELDKKS